MAKKDQTVKLTLDFGVEKSNLQKIGNELSALADKTFSGAKAKNYVNDIKKATIDMMRASQTGFKGLDKPLHSKNDAKSIAGNISSSFKTLDNILLSVQGNVSKTYSSISNMTNLKKIRTLGNEIDKLVKSYQAISGLNVQHKNLGNKSTLTKKRNAHTRELSRLSQKEGGLTTDELSYQKKLKKEIKDINNALLEKENIEKRIALIQQDVRVSTQSELQNKINAKIGEQNELTDISMNPTDYNTIKSTLDSIRSILSEIAKGGNLSSEVIGENFEQVKEEGILAEKQSKTINSVLRDLGVPLLTLREITSALKQVARYSFEYVKNLDSALTEISVVSNKSREEVLKLTDTFIELSAKTGMAIDDIAQASTIFYQQGLNDEAVKRMTEYTALFAKISGESVPKAADQLTSAINGFNYSSDQVGEVVDKMSVLAAYSAADIDELATAMTKGASAASQAGLSFDEYNAYLATMIETTREAPENIGTSLKTIMARFQQIKKGGTTEDGETDVNAVETALKSVGVSLRGANNQLRDLGDVLNDLGPKWSHLDRNTQAYLGTIIAGTRQQSRFISLMQHWDRAMDLVAASENSAGAAAEMHGAAMEGLEATINNLTNAWQKLISNIVNGNSFKGIIKFATKFIKWFAKGNSVLKLLSVGILLINTRTLLMNISLKKQHKAVKTVETAWSSFKDAIIGVKSSLGIASKQINKTTTDIENQTDAINNNTLAKKRNSGEDITPNGKEDTFLVTTSGKKGKFSLKDFFKKGKLKGQSIISGGTELLGKFQMATTLISSIYLITDSILDAIEVTGEELKEKAQEKYDIKAEEIFQYTDIVQAVDKNLDAYDRLSKKINRSTEEINEMGEAAQELAKAIPGAVIGYDKDGNPIIDVASAKKARRDAEKNAAELAKEQANNIGDLIIADTKTLAEQNYGESKSSKLNKVSKTAGIGLFSAGGTAGIGLLTGAIAAGPAGIAIASIVTLTGAIMALTSVVGKSNDIAEEERKLLHDQASKILLENMPDMQKQLQLVTQNTIKDRDIEGVSAGQRIQMAGYMGNAFFNTKWDSILNDADQKYESGKLSKKKYSEYVGKQIGQIGTEWSTILDQVGDRELATIYNKVEAIRPKAGSKSYKDIKDIIENLINNDLKINKNSETGKALYDLLVEAFMNASFTGVKGGVNNAIKDLEKQKDTLLKSYANKYGKENGGYQQQETYYDNLIKKAGQMNSKDLGFYNDMGLTKLTIFGTTIDKYGEEIHAALEGETGDAVVKAINILNGYVNYAEDVLNNIARDSGQGDSYKDINPEELDEIFKEDYDKWINILEDSKTSIDIAWNSLEESMDTSWKDLFDFYEKVIDRTKTVRESLNLLASGEGMDYDQWKDFAQLFDKVPFEEMDLTDMERYQESLDIIADSLHVENGMIYANADALKAIGQIEEDIANAQINEEKTKLKVKRHSLEIEQDLLSAQQHYYEALLEESEGSINAEQAKADAREEFNNAVNSANVWLMQQEVETSEKDVEIWGNAFSRILSMKNKLNTTMADPNASYKEIENARNDFERAWNNASKDLKLQEFEQNELSKEEYQNQLKAKIEGIKRRSGAIGNLISNINVKLKILDSGIRKTTNGLTSSSKALDKYISKLERFLNLIKHIEREEINLEIATKLKDMQTRTAVLDRMADQLRYVTHLIGDMTEMFDNEEKEANNAAATIRKQYGDLVSFNAWGNYEVDMDKYNKMSDKNKEDLENQLKNYEEIIKARDDYYKKYLDYKKQERDINQEYVDKYIDGENKLLEAVKSREQKILDAKMAAIDKEIEGINKAAEARRKAREEEKDAREMSGLQTDLQRALMDSSGSSATDILNIQKQIKDKQEDLSDEAFDNMVDDMNTELENEKDLEQKLFDERLEEMDWYWDEVDRIMGEGTNSILDTMKTYMDEFNQSSEIQQAELLKGWENTFIQAVKIGKVGAQNYQKIVANLQEIIDGLIVDEDVLTNGTINTNFEKRPVIKDTSSSGGGGGNKHTTISNSHYKRPSNTTNKNNNTPNKPPVKYYTIYFQNGSQTDKRTVQEGYKITMPTLTKRGYKLEYWQSAALNACVAPGRTITVNRDDTFIAFWKIVEEKVKPGIIPNIRGNSNKKPDWRIPMNRFASGGLSYHSGPAWLDGTSQKPEAVLDNIQTKAFLQFTDDLSKIKQGDMIKTNSNVVIDNISFNVESMSSISDGEKAFDAFVNKFKEIGGKQGISILGTSNRK